MRKSLLLIASFLVAGALLFFPVRFAIAFELLGYAVNSPSEGWLGPTPRNASACVIDAGKVNSWTCRDTSVFAEHRLGCDIWLKVFGYSGT